MLLYVAVHIRQLGPSCPCPRPITRNSRHHRGSPRQPRHCLRAVTVSMGSRKRHGRPLGSCAPITWFAKIEPGCLTINNNEEYLDHRSSVSFDVRNLPVTSASSAIVRVSLQDWNDLLVGHSLAPSSRWQNNETSNAPYSVVQGQDANGHTEEMNACRTPHQLRAPVTKEMKMSFSDAPDRTEHWHRDLIRLFPQNQTIANRRKTDTSHAPTTFSPSSYGPKWRRLRIPGEMKMQTTDTLSSMVASWGRLSVHDSTAQRRTNSVMSAG